MLVYDMIDLRSKKILVTGGKGFLGSHVVENLINKRKVPPKNIRITSSSENDLRQWYNCLSAVKDIDVIIHLAGRTGGIGYNRRNPGSLFYDNIIMNTMLIEAARLEGVEKFVGIGSVCSYPKFTPVPFREIDLWNGYPEETNAPYGLAKKMMLVQSQAYRQQYRFNAIHLLMTNLYGPRDHFDLEDSHVIPALIMKFFKAKLNDEDKVIIWGTGKATREFLYVEDAAEGILLAAERYDGSDPINLGSGVEITIKNLAETISSIIGYSGDIVWDHSKPDGQPKRCLDVTKAEYEFGFKASTPLNEGLKKTILWYKKYLLKE